MRLVATLRAAAGRRRSVGEPVAAHEYDEECWELWRTFCRLRVEKTARPGRGPENERSPVRDASGAPDGDSTREMAHTPEEALN